MAIAESDRVAETTQEPVDVTIWESAAVASLHALNTGSVRAFADSDMTWYEDHLSDHFVCTPVDGQRIDKAEFLERARQRSSARDVRCDEVDVHVLGEVALVSGVIHYLRSGMLVLTRYTMVWQSQHGRWRAVVLSSQK